MRFMNESTSTQRMIAENNEVQPERPVDPKVVRLQQWVLEQEEVAAKAKDDLDNARMSVVARQILEEFPDAVLFDGELTYEGHDASLHAKSVMTLDGNEIEGATEFADKLIDKQGRREMVSFATWRVHLAAAADWAPRDVLLDVPIDAIMTPEQESRARVAKVLAGWDEAPDHPEYTVEDVLIDLRYHADCEGLDFEEILQSSRENYQQ
jgi:hypothetical protein